MFAGLDWSAVEQRQVDEAFFKQLTLARAENAAGSAASHALGGDTNHWVVTRPESTWIDYKKCGIKGKEVDFLQLLSAMYNTPASVGGGSTGIKPPFGVIVLGVADPNTGKTGTPGRIVGVDVKQMDDNELNSQLFKVLSYPLDIIVEQITLADLKVTVGLLFVRLGMHQGPISFFTFTKGKISKQGIYFRSGSATAELDPARDNIKSQIYGAFQRAPPTSMPLSGQTWQAMRALCLERNPALCDLDRFHWVMVNAFFGRQAFPPASTPDEDVAHFARAFARLPFNVVLDLDPSASMAKAIESQSPAVLEKRLLDEHTYADAIARHNRTLWLQLAPAGLPPLEKISADDANLSSFLNAYIASNACATKTTKVVIPIFAVPSQEDLTRASVFDPEVRARWTYEEALRDYFVGATERAFTSTRKAFGENTQIIVLNFVDNETTRSVIYQALRYSKLELLPVSLAALSHLLASSEQRGLRQKLRVSPSSPSFISAPLSQTVLVMLEPAGVLVHKDDLVRLDVSNGVFKTATPAADEVAADCAAFLRGEKPLAWSLCADRKYSVQRDIVTTWLTDVVKQAERPRASTLTIHHDAGAGGTTAARQMLIDLSVFVGVQCICMWARAALDYKDLQKVLQQLHKEVQCPVVCVLEKDENMSIFQRKADMVADLGDAHVVLVFIERVVDPLPIQVARRTAIRGGQTAALGSQLSTSEITELLGVYETVCGSMAVERVKVWRVKDVGKYDAAVHTMLYFALAAFDHNFAGLERYMDRVCAFFDSEEPSSADSLNLQVAAMLLAMLAMVRLCGGMHVPVSVLRKYREVKLSTRSTAVQLENELQPLALRLELVGPAASSLLSTRTTDTMDGGVMVANVLVAKLLVLWVKENKLGVLQAAGKSIQNVVMDLALTLAALGEKLDAPLFYPANQRTASVSSNRDRLNKLPSEQLLRELYLSLRINKRAAGPGGHDRRSGIDESLGQTVPETAFSTFQGGADALLHWDADVFETLLALGMSSEDVDPLRLEVLESLADPVTGRRSRSLDVHLALAIALAAQKEYERAVATCENARTWSGESASGERRIFRALGVVHWQWAYNLKLNLPMGMAGGTPLASSFAEVIDHAQAAVACFTDCRKLSDDETIVAAINVTEFDLRYDIVSAYATAHEIRLDGFFSTVSKSRLPTSASVPTFILASDVAMSQLLAQVPQSNKYFSRCLDKFTRLTAKDPFELARQSASANVPDDQIRLARLALCVALNQEPGLRARNDGQPRGLRSLLAVLGGNDTMRPRWHELCKCAQAVGSKHDSVAIYDMWGFVMLGTLQPPNVDPKPPMTLASALQLAKVCSPDNSMRRPADALFVELVMRTALYLFARPREDDMGRPHLLLNDWQTLRQRKGSTHDRDTVFYLRVMVTPGGSQPPARPTLLLQRLALYKPANTDEMQFYAQLVNAERRLFSVYDETHHASVRLKVLTTNRAPLLPTDQGGAWFQVTVQLHPPPVGPVVATFKIIAPKNVSFGV